jgi:ABC-2 type transport system permease protein
MALIGIRQRAMIAKEVQALLRDPKSRQILFLPPLIQLLLFSFAATLEVKNVDIGLLDRSGGAASVELVSRIAGSPNFRDIVPLRSPAELERAIDRQEVIAAIVIDEDFDRDMARGRPATIGLILDGRRSNAAQIVGGYVAQIAADTGLDLAESRTGRERAPPGSVAVNWFNPNLDFIWFNLPALLVVIVSVSGLAITSQVVAREREMGTFDQLLVSPLRVHEILIGKMVPSFLVGMTNGSIFILAARFAFGVPFTGNLPLFLVALAVYNVSLIGVGMFVSALSRTQQQAFLGSFAATTPLILLSGFASPIENMPRWLQVATWFNPASYFLEISLGQFLKAMPLDDTLHLLWPMLAIACVTLALAAWLFRARME